MRSEAVNEILSLIEAQVKFRPSSIEFEMAYQIRVAIDRIRFAIKAADNIAGRAPELQEAGLQLLDALDRLESTDRDFQGRFRQGPRTANCETSGKRVNADTLHATNGNFS